MSGIVRTCWRFAAFIVWGIGSLWLWPGERLLDLAAYCDDKSRGMR